jgi:Zn-dependent protease with chaperone function
MPGADVSYPGEATSLAVAIVVTVIVATMLTLISFGMALGVVALALLQVQFSARRVRDRALRVSESQHSKISNLASLAAFRLGLPQPSVYVLADSEPNAYTSGFLGQHWIVLTSKLVDILEPDELLFVIGHELGHIRREHVTWLVLTSPQGGILFPPVRLVLGFAFAQWLQRAEFSADRAGLLACRSIDAAERALIRVTHWAVPVDREQFGEKALEDSVFSLSELFETHPALVRRLGQIREFGRVAERRGQLCSA